MLERPPWDQEMETKVALATLDFPSTDARGVRLVHAGGSVELTLQIAPNLATGFTFGGVRALRKRAEIHCTEWHIEGAFDVLVEVQGSGWVRELQADTATGWKDYFPLRHFMIYLDSAGCVEADRRLLGHSSQAMS